jgi:hypothetical protein
MHIIQNYTLKQNVVKKVLPLVMALLQGIKKLFNSRLPDSTIWGVDFPLRNSVHCHVPLIKFFLRLTVVINERIK